MANGLLGDAANGKQVDHAIGLALHRRHRLRICARLLLEISCDSAAPFPKTVHQTDSLFVHTPPPFCTSYLFLMNSMARSGKTGVPRTGHPPSAESSACASIDTGVGTAPASHLTMHAAPCSAPHAAMRPTHVHAAPLSRSAFALAAIKPRTHLPARRRNAPRLRMRMPISPLACEVTRSKLRGCARTSRIG